MYMDDLSIALNNTVVLGGYLGNALLNQLCYADDICRINLSFGGIQQLLIRIPSFYLTHLKIPIVGNCKYFGITISMMNFNYVSS